MSLKIGFGKNEVLCPKGEARRIGGKASRTASSWDPTGAAGGDAGNSTSMSSGSGEGKAKSELGSAGFAAPLALAQRGRVRLDLVED